MRALPKERPESLTAPADGQKLEEVIGELQSVWGVPQYPQEYRITLKVAEEREARAEAPPAEAAPEQQTGDGPKREKAPSAPMMRRPGDQPQREKAPARKRRRRRRRGGGGGSGDTGGAGPA